MKFHLQGLQNRKGHRWYKNQLHFNCENCNINLYVTVNYFRTGGYHFDVNGKNYDVSYWSDLNDILPSCEEMIIKNILE